MHFLFEVCACRAWVAASDIFVVTSERPQNSLNLFSCFFFSSVVIVFPHAQQPYSMRTTNPVLLRRMFIKVSLHVT